MSDERKKQDNKSRRELMRDGAAAAAGMAVGLSGAAKAEEACCAAKACGAPGPAAASPVQKARSYNPGMKYRPLGKTNLMVSACCMGGHWKRAKCRSQQRRLQEESA